MSLSIDQVQDRLDKGHIGVSELLLMRRQLGIPFRLHPLGFIACTLLTERRHKLRLHCWPTLGGVEQSPDCRIHDHLFEFRSWVMSGSVENIEYDVSLDGPEYSIYETEYLGDQSVLTKTDRLLRLAQRTRETYVSGTSYSVRAGTLHETVRVGSESALTVLVARDVSNSAPLVLAPKAGLDRYTYTRSIVEESLVDKMLAAI